ncbi:nucleoside triphosphate pyrophosphohydrolase [Thalassolituus sp.]|uniref:nucleoside triphosphate pyrophosphohydrolase n=1 Tax=Thalassolituus sp. TaxID=2030822 RepID=UPI002A7F8AD9|nr:nucleoside triphosphate pyrophosphohydrolase [Thalassolituus sp.]
MIAQYGLEQLLYTMQRLRNPQTGCPWDLRQDFASILPHTLEEAYEVADAIERQDWPHLEEELGDLLFQVIFYGQMGAEQGRFDLSSIIHRLVEKLIRRHPHVFPDGTLTSQRDPSIRPQESEVNIRWDEIKAAEKAAKPAKIERLLDDVPVTLPALSRAFKLQKKASSVGFDWPDIHGVLDKIREELDEVEAEFEGMDSQRLEDEIGDALFAITNLARHLKVDPEVALRGTNERFYQRFSFVEDAAEEAGGFSQLELEHMDAAWDEAKRRGK